MGVEEPQGHSPTPWEPAAKSGSGICTPGVGFLGPTEVRGIFLAAEVPSLMENPQL